MAVSNIPRKKAMEAKDKAKGFLEILRPSENRQILMDLADYVIERKK